MSKEQLPLQPLPDWVKTQIIREITHKQGYSCSAVYSVGHEAFGYANDQASRYVDDYREHSKARRGFGGFEDIRRVDWAGKDPEVRTQIRVARLKAWFDSLEKLRESGTGNPSESG